MKQWMVRILLFSLIPAVGTAATNYDYLYNKRKDSIYLVYPVNDKNKIFKQGSGVAIGPDLLVTNCHVSHGAKYIMVSGGNKTKERYAARPVYENLKRDICVLRIRGAKLNPAPMRPSASLKVGERIYAIGAPKGNERFFSIGKILQIHKTDKEFLIVSDQVGDQGSSGGGLFDLNGNLIGIVSAMFLDKDRHMISQAIEPVIEVMQSELATPLKQGTNVRTHLLGTYGKDQVKLYRANKTCFIILKSIQRLGLRYSFFIWSLRHPEVAFVFPVAPTETGALSKIATVFSGEVKTEFKPVAAYLHLNSISTQLIAPHAKSEFYVVKLPVEANKQLVDSAKLYLLFNFADWTYTTNKLELGTRGISRAKQQSRVYC